MKTHKFAQLQQEFDDLLPREGRIGLTAEVADGALSAFLTHFHYSFCHFRRKDPGRNI